MTTEFPRLVDIVTSEGPVRLRHVIPDDPDDIHPDYPLFEAADDVSLARLKKRYVVSCFGPDIAGLRRVGNQWWIQIHLDDAHYGSPEYLATPVPDGRDAVPTAP